MAGGIRPLAVTPGAVTANNELSVVVDNTNGTAGTYNSGAVGLRPFATTLGKVDANNCLCVVIAS